VTQTSVVHLLLLFVGHFGDFLCARGEDLCGGKLLFIRNLKRN
jgi:hypothetical protein